MIGFSRTRSLAVCAGILALSAGWTLGARPTLSAQSPAADGALDPALGSAFKWRSVGPDRGGRSIAVSGVKGRPKEAYFGATGGGLWKTTDGGAKWTPVTDGQITSSSVGAVAVSESSPDIVYIGMGEACIRGNIMGGDGVYKSIDAGKTWTNVGFHDSDAISKIRIHPTNPDIVFVADFGRYGKDNDERGVFKTIDGGKSWKKVLFRNAKTGAIDVAIDRKNPSVMYAALWEAFRVEYQMSSGGPGSGLFKSTDGGETWKEITRNPGLPAGMIGKIGIALTTADENRVYALVENENGGLLASDDAGATWKMVNVGRNIRQRAFYYTHVFADHANKDIVYALNTSAFRSVDGGKTFANIGNGTHGDNHDIWIDPDDPAHVVLGNDGGGAVTFNVGAGQQRTWSGQEFPTEQFYHVISTKHVPYHLCGAQQDNSTMCVPSTNGMVGRGGQRTVEPFYPVGGNEDGYIAPDPKDSDVFFSGSNNGSFITRLNRRTGELREVNPYPRFFSGENSASVIERWQWTFPIIFSPVDPNILYTSSQHVWKTTDQGQTWEKISGDLTRHDPKTMQDSGGPITHDMNSPEIYATVFALAPGKTDVNIIWAGSDDGVVHLTRDGGQELDEHHPEGHAGFRPGQPDRRLVDGSRHRLHGGQETAARGFLAVPVSHARLRPDVDEDCDRHSGQRLHPCGARGSDAPRPALRRHPARVLYLVRRRRPLAAAEERAAGHAGPRHLGRSRRRGHRHARPRLLHPGRCRAAAAVRRPGHHRDQRLSVQAVRRDTLGVPGKDHLLAEEAGAEGDARDSRRQRSGDSHV